MTRRGFTLVEVLVSLAIFALAAVVLGAAYVNVLNGYNAVSHRGEYEQEMRLVRAQVLAEPDRTVVEKGGTFPLPGGSRSVRWTAVVDGTTVADLFRVTFRGQLDEPSRPQPVVREEVFLVLRPTWSDPAERDKLRSQSAARLQKVKEGR